MTAYYNEIDPYAAQWLCNLIDAGHIASGVVDTRSIEDVHPHDLDGFTQCHFFAGIGVWSYALRLAGWPDDRLVWTGSCPCQPFSTAGKGTGFADERHLWPSWHHLISQHRPAVVFGEQVASKDAEPWLDLVQDDLEGLGYALGAVPFPSAGVGAPHIRDRLYWVACADRDGRQGRGLHLRQRRPHEALPVLGRRREAGLVADTQSDDHRCEAEPSDHQWAQADGPADRPSRCGSALGSLGDADCINEGAEQGILGRPHASAPRMPTDEPAGPTNGHWRAADWLLCRDGKWRPVSPKPQPMVDGSAESLGRVRTDTAEAVEREVNAFAMESQIDPAEAMRDVLASLGAQAKRCWPVGGLPGLHEAPFLLAFVRQLAQQGWRVAQRLPLSCEEVAQAALRGMWGDCEPASAPRRYGLEEQRAQQRADLVPVLSSLLARHALEAWAHAYATYAEIGFPLAHGASARVGRLRAYGNAINARAAEAFIQSVMECTQ